MEPQTINAIMAAQKIPSATLSGMMSPVAYFRTNLAMGSVWP
jgi:hypothetical protein